MTTTDFFERDLLDCGVPFTEAHALRDRYAQALESRSHVDWIELYIGTYTTLRRDVHCTRIADPAALERMRLLLNDDLGSQLFEEAAI